MVPIWSLLRAIGLVGVAVVVGLLAGWGVLYVMLAVLQPSGSDDTIRAIAVVGLPLLTWALTGSIIFAVGLLGLRRKR